MEEQPIEYAEKKVSTTTRLLQRKITPCMPPRRSLIHRLASISADPRGVPGESLIRIIRYQVKAY